jgi:uncharacterized protein involved in outer membrane biogenesis
MVLNNKPFKIIAGAILFYFIFSYWAVNPLAKRIIPWVADKQLVSNATVEQVQFDPLALSLTVDKLNLTRKDGVPLVSFKQLFVDFEIRSIIDWAWHFKDIRLTEPKVNVDVDAKGKLNWADLLAQLNKEPSTDSELTKLILDKISIEQGQVQYAERNRSKPFNTLLKPLNLELIGLSTLPKDRGEYAITAKLPQQGATLRWKGDISVAPLASNGVVDVQGLKLSKLLQLLNIQNLPMQITAGDVQTQFKYNFAMEAVKDQLYPSVKLSNVVLAVTQLMADMQAQGQLSLEHAEAQIPAIDFSMKNQAQLVFSNMLFKAKQLAINQNKQPILQLSSLDVNGLTYDLQQSQLKVADVVLDTAQVSARRSKDGQINWTQFFPESKATETIASENTEVVKKEESVDAPSKVFAFDIEHVQLKHGQLQFDDQSFSHPLTVDAKDIDFAFDINNADGNLKLANMNSSLNNISLSSTLYAKPLASLSKIDLQDGQINLQDKQINIPILLLTGLSADVLREDNNALNWQQALTQVTARKIQNVKQVEADAWKLAINKASLEKSKLHIVDKNKAAPVQLDAENIGIALQDLSLNLNKTIPVHAKLELAQGGKVDISGKLALQPVKGDLQLKLDGVALKPFASYLSQVATLKLTDGQASAQGKLLFDVDKAFNSKFTGGFSVNNLAIVEDNGAPFLAWKQVASKSVSLELGKNQLHMDSLSIIEPVGKFIIHEDKTLNLKRVLRATPAETPEATKTEFPVNIERINIDNAAVEFADLSLTPQFGANIKKLTGVINGFSSDVNATALVELDGQVDEYGSAHVRGSLKPFQATEFTDIKLGFVNLDMNRLTPYSGKFAGRKINSGKLTVNLEYKIKQRQLFGENKFIINKIALGERVDSKDAANLPLDLAIALLEDSDGIIDLDLPITGSLDDPQFSYGKVIWKAFVNVLGKVVTAPFRLLGKLLGGDTDKIGNISFDFGSAELAPEQQEKLNALVSALNKRTNLTLTLYPSYDAVADKRALQVQLTRAQVLKELDIELKAGERPGPVDVANVKAQTAIDNLLKDRKGESRGLKALSSIQNIFKKSKAEDLPIYREKLEQLITTAPISDADLATLAQDRNKALQDYLVEKSGLDAKRLQIGELSKVETDGKSLNVKMGLGVAK